MQRTIICKTRSWKLGRHKDLRTRARSFWISQGLYTGEILSVLTIVHVKGSLLVPAMKMTTCGQAWKDDVHCLRYHRSVGTKRCTPCCIPCPLPWRWETTNSEWMDIIRVALMSYPLTMIISFRTYNAVMNIVTDLALGVVPTLIVLPLQTDSNKRFTLLVGFWYCIL